MALVGSRNSDYEALFGINRPDCEVDEVEEVGEKSKAGRREKG